MSDDRISTAAADLIASLPDNAGELRRPQVQALADLYKRIVAATEAGREAIMAMLELTAQRGAREDVPPTDFLTDDERTEFDDSQRRALDADRASEALSAWEARSGWAAMTGQPVPQASPEPMAIEDENGELLYRLPGPGGRGMMAELANDLNLIEVLDHGNSNMRALYNMTALPNAEPVEILLSICEKATDDPTVLAITLFAQVILTAAYTAGIEPSRAIRALSDDWYKH